MAIKITKTDVKWSYISLALSNGINIILLPFILAYLNSEEVGLWYTFAAISGLVIILDFGFMTTLSRNITFVWSGANSIQKQGFSNDENNNSSPNYTLFIKLFKTTKIIYFIIGAVILIILSTCGTYYIYHVSREVIPLYTALISWLFYFLAVFLNMRFAYWNAILKGIGAIKQNQQLIIITKLSQLVFTVVFLLMGYGLIGVSIAYLISVAINRITANFFFYNYQGNRERIKPLMKMKIDKKEITGIAREIWPNTLKQGLVSISNYISLRSMPLLSASYLGLSTTASIGLTLQLVNLITVLGNTFFNTFSAQFSSYRFKREFSSLNILFNKAIKINYVIVIFGFTMILFFLNEILLVIGSNVEVLPKSLLAIILIYYFLFNNHTLFASFIATGNSLPHYKAFFFSSVIALTSQFLLLEFYAPSSWALILPILIVQLSYNNWKWPLVVIKDTKKKVSSELEVSQRK